MRLKLGRPDLANYGRYFDAPAAGPDAPLTVTWAGVTTLLIDDGTSAVMTDGFFSRPGLLEVGLRRLSPSAPTAGPSDENSIGIWPPIRSVIAGPPPLYGT